MTGPTSTASTVSGSIFDRLRADILGDTLHAGDPLPSERALAEELGCNRHAVREAVKRLQQAGLVEVAQGGATRVRDWRATGGLDLLTQLTGATADGTVDPRLAVAVLPGVLEMRACIGTDVAGRAAERADADTLLALPGHLTAVTACAPDDLAARETAYAHLWTTLVDGAQNLAYRLAFNSLVAGVGAIGAPALALLADELRDDDGHVALVDAVVRRDAPAAEIAARALLTTVPSED